MKAVCFENSTGTNIQGKEPYFYLKPETAFLLNNRPFFIPDYANDIRIQLFVAIKISKIGKYISNKFAFDYFDAYTAGICFTAYDLYNDLKLKEVSADIARNFDFSSPIGKFIPKTDFENFRNIMAKLSSGNEISAFVKTSDLKPDFCEMISIASRFVSLKIGDIVMVTSEISVKPVSINDMFKVTINDIPLLSVEIK
jgi:2-keto-4-pentenoate hydratase/2-oxohepta-3-ene-1,7-dioic acid hydratase in catechol pathway